MSQPDGHTGGPPDLRPFADNFIPIIFVDRKQHTDEQPFCWDEDCFCHTDAAAIARIKELYESGLLTAQEAEWTIKGKIV